MSSRTDTPTETEERKPVSKTAWKRAKTHFATLPSGVTVEITLPNLSQMLKAGDIPNPLVDAAIQFQQAQEVTKEMLENSFDFACFILPHTLVNPSLTEEEVRAGDIPSEDMDMLIAFVSRTTDIDAVGHHLGGLESNRDFRRFRDLLTVDEIAEGLR